MKKPGVIVCEQSGIWATALRRHLPEGIRLRQTRGLVQCVSELAASPDSLLVLEWTRDNVADVLDLLGGLGQTFPRARAVVVAERGWESYEWLLREAGAVSFTTSPRQAANLAWLARRHGEGIPTPPATVAAQLWDTLPWSDAALA